MNMVEIKNIAALVTSRIASDFVSLTAGGAGNGVAVTGIGVQRSLIRVPRSAAINLFWKATLAAGKTLSLTNVITQDSADGLTWATYVTHPDPGVVATGPAGGGVVTGQTTVSVGFAGCRDYVRILFTPTLNAANTDTASVVATMVLAGSDRLPAPT